MGASASGSPSGRQKPMREPSKNLEEGRERGGAAAAVLDPEVVQPAPLDLEARAEPQAVDEVDELLHQLGDDLAGRRVEAQVTSHLAILA